MKKFILLTCCFTLTACVSTEEMHAAGYAYQSLLQEQCQDVLGFPVGTTQHMQCRMFYEEMYKPQTSYMSYSQVNSIRNKIYSMNQQCQNYWGNQNISKTALWSCIQQKGNAIITENKRKKELQEQEEMLRRTFDRNNTYYNSSYDSTSDSSDILANILLGN